MESTNIKTIKMKTTIKISFSVFLLLVSVICYGQVSNGDIRINSSGEYALISSIDFAEIDRTSKKVLGSSYINENFIPGNITDNDLVFLFRYNAYKDIMEVELKGKPYYLPKTNLSTYSIDFFGIDKVYQILNFKENKETNKCFFVAVYLGDKVSLYLKEKVKLYKEVPAKLGFTRYEPAKLERVKDELFFVINETAHKIPKRKKDVLKFFSDKEKEMESFSKKNKIDYKSQKDLWN